MNSEDFNRRKMIVTVLTVGSSILLLGLMLTHFFSYFSSEKSIRIGVSLYLIPTLLIGHTFLYVLIRKNKIYMVSFALTVLYTLGSIYGAYIWGISMPSALLLYFFSNRGCRNTFFKQSRFGYYLCFMHYNIITWN